MGNVLLRLRRLLSLMGAPISWVATHRLHHQKSDLPGDPHSPRDGFKHALYEWMMHMEEKQDAAEVARADSIL
ncbi:MAG: hypothetical protein IPM93_24930 [Candidatus Obscuribacter sp.]|nr:hypothetical protein [Candidatus Obscuribacter sp.]